MSMLTEVCHHAVTPSHVLLQASTLLLGVANPVKGRALLELDKANSYSRSQYTLQNKNQNTIEC